MPSDRQPPPLPTYMDDPACREVYPETVQVVIDSAGLLRIELCVHRWSHAPPVEPNRTVPVARIALPAGLATMLHDQLSRSLEALQRGAELAQAPAASETRQ
jgi:hypothetical protein